MSQTTGQLPNLLNVKRLASFKIGLDVAITALFVALAFQIGGWQLNILAGLGVATTMVTIIGARLSWRNRTELGSWIIIGGGLPLLVISSTLIADLGMVLALSVIALTGIGAVVALPPKQVGRAVVIGLAVGSSVMLIDVFESPFDRLELPVAVQTFISVAAGILLLTYGYFIVRQFRNYSLQTKFIVTFLAVTLTSLALLTFLNNWLTQARLTDEANRALFTAAYQTTIELDNFINHNLEVIRTEAQLPLWFEYLSLAAPERANSSRGAEVRATLRALSRKANVSSYALLDLEGQTVMDTFASHIGLNRSDREYFQQPLKTGLSYVSPVQFSPTTGKASIYFSSPIRNAAQNIVGVLRIRYDASVLQQIVSQNNDLAGEESFAVLFDENFFHLAHGVEPDTLFTGIGAPDPGRLAELRAASRLPDLPVEKIIIPLPDLEQHLRNAATQPYFEALDIATGDKINQIAATAMTTQPWLVAFFQPQDVFLAPIRTQTQTTFLLAIVVAVIVGGIAFGVGRYLSNPIVRLTAVAQQITGGQLEVRAAVESQDEIGQLSQTFNSMTAQLRGMIGSLEDQVRERTVELTLSMKVGQRAAMIRELDELLPVITEFIRERFGLYYTQVYFVDDPGRNLLLRAGTGTVGEELLARSHSIPVGPGSIVGQVAAIGQSIVVPDIGSSDIHQPNPLLPETRSELAIPLIVEGRVIGVLDMQSNQVNTFTEQNLTVFEAMATQLAVSIDSAQQWEASQSAQRRAEEALRLLTRENWSETLSKRRQGLSFAYALDDSIRPLKVNGSSHGQSEFEGDIAVPLIVQNQPIGQLSVQKPAHRNLSSDEQALLSAVAQQLAQKAENLRLFEATQEQANREHIARQITDKIRASRDIETALRTAAEGLSKALGTARAVVDLKVELQSSDQEPPNQ
jgi:GAF domain-containing protein/HAMP domain-containing protein